MNNLREQSIKILIENVLYPQIRDCREIISKKDAVKKFQKAYPNYNLSIEEIEEFLEEVINAKTNQKDYEEER